MTKKDNNNSTITLQDKAIKLISDLEYYETEKEYLSDFEKDLIEQGHFLKDYISQLEYNLKRSNYRERLAKKLLDDTKANDNYIIHNLAKKYNDLKDEIEYLIYLYDYKLDYKLNRQIKELQRRIDNDNE